MNEDWRACIKYLSFVVVILILSVMGGCNLQEWIKASNPPDFSKVSDPMTQRILAWQFVSSHVTSKVDEMAIEAFKEGLMSPKVYRAATVNMMLQHEQTYHPGVVMSNEVAVIPPMDIDTNLVEAAEAVDL